MHDITTPSVDGNKRTPTVDGNNRIHEMIYMFLSFMIAIKANANVESYRKLLSGSVYDCYHGHGTANVLGGTLYPFLLGKTFLEYALGYWFP